MQHLNSRQVAAVLCGLRLVQQRLQMDSPRTKLLSADHRAILTGDGGFKPLTLSEIDALCQLINLRQTITFPAKEIDRVVIELGFAADEAEISLEVVDSDEERRCLLNHRKLARHLARKFLRIANTQGAVK
jgi:hypothetical protein